MPLCVRVVDESAWRKRSNMNGMKSGVMPGPLSCTMSSQPPSALRSHFHAPALRRELDGVTQQVPHHLLQAIRVAGDWRCIQVDEQLESNALGVGRGLDRFGRRADDVAEIDTSQRQPDLAGHDPLHVENVRDQLFRPGAMRTMVSDAAWHARDSHDPGRTRAQLVMARAARAARERASRAVVPSRGRFRLRRRRRALRLAVRGVEEPDVVEESAAQPRWPRSPCARRRIRRPDAAQRQRSNTRLALTSGQITPRRAGTVDALRRNHILHSRASDAAHRPPRSCAGWR